MLVVDASAAYDALVGRDPLDGIGMRLARADELAAPCLIDVEVINALRKSVLAGRLTADRASDARDDFAGMALSRFPHEPFIDRIWELRDQLSAYDAAYLALAEAIGIPLITCDARLAAVARESVEVEFYPPEG